MGGAVRDKLLGLPIQDQDFVVVGADVTTMLKLGFLPVGKDFPVFLHPITHDEYALARTERKSGRGYKGFYVDAAVSVSLEEDLARRDLTINAMAEDGEGNIIDPFHGQQDLKEGVLRHVSIAFVEDPVRILRIARFAARFGFTIADETFSLMQEMVVSGEVADLVAERVWQEMVKALMALWPARFFEVLRLVDALKVILPELAGLGSSPYLAILNTIAAQQASLMHRFGVLTFSLDQEALNSLGARLRLPKELLSLMLRLQAEKTYLLQAKTLSISDLLVVLLRCDVIRRPKRFEEILMIMGSVVPEWKKTGLSDFLQKAALCVRQVDGKAVAALVKAPQEIPLAIEVARKEALAKLITRA